MAANLDKSESSLSSVSDVAYVRGLDSSGNSVKISKSDLASVLGALSTFAPIKDATEAELDTVSPGAYMVGTSDSPFGVGAGVLYMIQRNDTFAQIYIVTGNYQILKRYKSGYSGTWSAWKYNYDESMLTNQSLLSPLASALGVEVVANHPGISAIGNGSQCKICRFIEGMEEVAYLPLTVIVTCGYAYTSFYYNGSFNKFNWKWENNQWVIFTP